MKMTKKRNEILEIIKKSKSPLSADLILKKLPDGQMNLTTIYRNLDFLYINQLISKTMVNNTAFYFANNENSHKHFMVCLDCKKNQELNCSINHYPNQDSEKFVVIQHDLTFYGYCEKCKNQKHL